jgi:CRISPR system Cascade subunit CasA
MPGYFNLATEPWIPVLFGDGTSGRVGWRDLIAESPRTFDVVTEPNHIYGIVVRLAAAMVLRTQGAPLGDPAPKAWQAWGEKALKAGPDTVALDAYFEKWGDRFWLLDDEHPFLQDVAIATECEKRASTNKLRLDVASGQNQLWWTKTSDKDAPTLSFAAGAMALLSQWGYAAGGGCASRASGANQFRTGSRSAKGLGAPQRSYSQFIPRGANFFETLLMACAPAPSDAAFAERDVPVWEVLPETVLVPGQMSRLTASTRGLLLFGDGNGVTEHVNTWGVVDRPLEFWAADVFMESGVDKDKKIFPVRVKMGEAVWREAPALLAERHDDATRIPPIALDAQRNPLGRTAGYSKGGVSVITHFADQSKNLGWSRAELPEVLGMAQAEDRKRYFEIEHFCTFATDELKTTTWLINKSNGEGSRSVQSADLFTLQLWGDAEALFYQVVAGGPWHEAALELLGQIMARFKADTEDVSAPAHLAGVLKTERSLGGQIFKAKKKYNLNNQKAEVSS